jgi:DNA/RNA-binding domain of Phe-tRNA-synthetase-like protein
MDVRVSETPAELKARIVGLAAATGSAVSDSVRTRVTEKTTRLLWVTFVPKGVAPDPAHPATFEEFAALMIRFNGGVVDKNTVFHIA